MGSCSSIKEDVSVIETLDLTSTPLINSLSFTFTFSNTTSLSFSQVSLSRFNCLNKMFILHYKIYKFA